MTQVWPRLVTVATRTALVALIVLGPSVGIPNQGRADFRGSDVPLDVTLLRSDAITFATIAALRPAPDDRHSTDVIFRDMRLIHSRFDSSITHIRVAGTPFRDEHRAAIRVNDRWLHEGRRYLFFLRGGVWRFGPFVASADYYHVGDDGLVYCSSRATVRGAWATTLACGEDHEVSAPALDEEGVAAMLRRRIAAARARRPELAAAEEAEGRTLVLRRAR